MRQCPRCASEISSDMKKCPRCGLPIENIEEVVNKHYNEETAEKILTKQDSQEPITRAQQRKETKLARKAEKKAERKEKRERESKSDTDFTIYATNSDANPFNEPISLSEAGKRSTRKLQKQKQLAPVFDLDENGEIHIETSDVEIVGEKTGRLISEVHEKNYSVKKARGEYVPPKIKWWEIYKLADLHFARRKIKKEVTKASKIKPSFISKAKLLILAILFGWCGAHNFYAKNKKKGWTSLICLFLWLGIVWLSAYIPFLNYIKISVGGCAGFICCFIWIGDIVNIALDTFKYRIQKEKFIFSMNVQTRAKLGEKYIDEELYYKPWWYRLKVWFEKKKRNYQEYRHERRQAMIEREKARLAKQEEKEKIEKEISDFENKENNNLKNKSSIKEENLKQTKKEKIKSSVDKNLIKDIDSFGDSDSVESQGFKTRKAKVVVNNKKSQKNKKNNKK